MKRLALSLFLVAALLLHFNHGIWSSQDSPDKGGDAKAEKKVDDAKKAEEKKEEEKKDEKKEPPKGNITGDGYGETIPDYNEVKDAKKATPDELAANQIAIAKAVGVNRAGINMMWTLLCGFLVMFMQAGFALVETGLTRAKNVAHTMSMNFMVYAVGMLGFFFVGYAVMYGGIGASFFGNDASLLASEFKIKLFGKEFGLFGYEGFMLMGRALDAGLLTMFLFQMVFMDTTCTIPTGTMAERWKFSAFIVFTIVISTIIYPVYGNWVWGGGWLSQLGNLFRLGHGHVDFAGSSVVHMTGGVSALAGGIVLGARIGKYNKDGSVNALPAHNLPMYVIGTFVLAFGWFGFNTGSTLRGMDLNIARIAVNTMLASAAGAATATAAMWIVFKKPDPSFMCNGMLAGLVAITAPCAFVTPVCAVVIGGSAGVLVIFSCFFWERVAKIDDPVGAISVHGVCGAFGILCVGLFADGSYGQGLNNSFWYRLQDKVTLQWFDTKPDLEKADQAATKALLDGATELGVTGIFYGNTGQLTASLIGIAANIVWVFLTAFIAFWIIELVIGNRTRPEVEIGGLDIPEMGVLGYINDDPTSPEGHVLHPSADPKSALVPPAAKNRFYVVVEGLAPDKIAAIWSELCKPSTSPPSAEFLAVYPKMTTLQGTRFRFTSGNAEDVRKQLARLLQAYADTTVHTRIET